MREDKNFFFVDDSGSRSWDNAYVLENCENPPRRDKGNLQYWRENYFILAGVHISGERMDVLNALIDSKKKEYFGTDRVEIKSHWLRQPEKQRKEYLDKYGVSKDRLREFIEDFWYSLFVPDNFVLQAFVLDKRFYSDREESPLSLLVNGMLDYSVISPVDRCDVVFDQMEEGVKSMRGDQGLISDLFAIAKKSSGRGASYLSVAFDKSVRSNGLQLADTVAYNVLRQFIQYGDQWDNQSFEMSEKYSYIARLLPCFHSDKGNIRGFGVVKIPNAHCFS